MRDRDNLKSRVERGPFRIAAFKIKCMQFVKVFTSAREP